MAIERICAHREAAYFMGNIIQLNDRQFQRRPPGARMAGQCRTASILFFTGVRYEYLAPERFAPEGFAPEGFAPCAKKVSKAQSVRLQAGKCVFDIPQLQ